MEITTTTIEKNPSRRAATNALAVVGFVVLIIIGIALAIYSSRYVPKLVSRVGSAAVSLSSVFHSGKDKNDASLQVVSTSTLPFEDTEIIAISTTTDEVTSATTTVTKTPTKVSSTNVVTTVVTQPASLYGNADLTITITDVGYLKTGDNTDSFVASDEVPDNKRGAVQFTVANNGTNVSGSWDFRAQIPTSPSFTYNSPTQPSLKPGDRIDYTLGFDHTKSGTNRVMTIIVDSGNDVSESNEDNNSDSEQVDIEK